MGRRFGALLFAIDRSNESSSSGGEVIAELITDRRMLLKGLEFPGFGGRLRIGSGLPTFSQTRSTTKIVGATRYQVAQGDWSRTISNVSPVSIGYQGQREWDCLAFLKESPFPLS